MRRYDLIKQLLTDHPALRDSDNKLIWMASPKFREAVMFGSFDQIEEEFMNIKFESIRRCRQKIQEKHEDLRGSKKVQEAREAKEKNWGQIIKEQITLI